jgi:hypothetical protein
MRALAIALPAALLVTACAGGGPFGRDRRMSSPSRARPN